MVLLMSSIEDKETDILAIRLKRARIPFIRLNTSFNIATIDFDIANKEVKLYSTNNLSEPAYTINNKIKVVWWRNEAFKLRSQAVPQKEFHLLLEKHFIKDWEVVVEAIEYILADSALFIGCPKSERQQNKIIDLLEAKKHGLSIPATFLSGNKKSLSDFASGKERLIYKHHGKRVNGQTRDHLIASGNTQELVATTLAKTPPSFVPTLFQECVKKEIELKALYLFGHLYTCAIFSQSNQKTKTDYRNTSLNKDIRLAAFNLPKEVQEKTIKLVKAKGLNICTVDFIVTEQKKYVFLEINPTGKFNWFTKHTNFPVFDTIQSKISHQYAAS